MSETIFVRMLGDDGKIRDSYRDYYTMVELSGYKQCSLGDIDFESDNVYIFSPDDGNSRACLTQEKAKRRKCIVVLWQLEWPDWFKRDDKGHVIESTRGELHGHLIPEYVDYMWISDRAYYNLIRHLGPRNGSRLQYVFMGGHPDFGNPDYEKNEVKWDFCHLSYVFGVREHKMVILSQRGFTFADKGNCWGEDREKALRESRWGLQLHQRPLPFMAPQRFLIFASYGLPILTDPLDDPHPYKVFQDGLIHWDPRETSVMNDQLRREAVVYNFQLVRYLRPFRDEVDAAVSWAEGVRYG